jgi:RNA polymerase sigma-70 factor (ECF subfamily)
MAATSVNAQVTGARQTVQAGAGLPAQSFEPPDCAALVRPVRDGNAAAIEELYGLFTRGIRYFLLRHLGPEEIDDKVHDCFITVLQAIHAGRLREPERLMGYVRIVVKRKIAKSIHLAMRQRRTGVHLDPALCSLCDGSENPERQIASRQRIEIARKIFEAATCRDREILHRFYVLEQSQEQIRIDMGLTYNQFRILKSRAKARLGGWEKGSATGGDAEITAASPSCQS